MVAGDQMKWLLSIVLCAVYVSADPQLELVSLVSPTLDRQIVDYAICTGVPPW